MKKLPDLTGKTFGRMTVLGEAIGAKSGWTKYKCACECGTIRIVRAAGLMDGSTRSCGCLRLDRVTKHGLYLKDVTTDRTVRVVDVARAERQGETKW